MIIDATDAVLGRIASQAAKRLLYGDQVIIINAEKAVISGKSKAVFDRYFVKRSRGDAYHGPYFPKYADRILWRTIRGMLPYKKPKGREALRRLHVYIGCPEEIKSGEKITKVKSELKCKYVTLKDVSKFLGAKVD